MRAPTSRDRTTAARLDRHEIDRIARAVASGRRGLGARLDGLADAIASGMTAKLAAAGLRATRRRPASAVALDHDTRRAIIARIEKHLPVVGEATSNASPRTR